MGASAGFFNRPEQKKTWVDTGGNNDHALRAVAAAIIDTVLSNPLTNHKWLPRLLERHQIFFPLQHAVMRLPRAEDRLISMASTSWGLAKLIQELSWTLKDLAEEEIAHNPEPYVGALNEQNEDKTLSNMFQPNAQIKAVAHVLALPVDLSVVLPRKEAALIIPYGPEPKHASDVLKIQVCQGRYIPKVRHVERFKAVHGQAIVASQPVVEANRPADPELSVIRAQIRQGDERLLKSYQQQVHRLATMVNAGELDKKQLLAAYIKGTGNSDTLKGRVKYLGTEHGNATFFEDLITRVRQTPLQLSTLENSNHDEQVVHELIQALARGISIGQMDEALVFEHMEEATYVRSAL